MANHPRTYKASKHGNRLLDDKIGITVTTLEEKEDSVNQISQTLKKGMFLRIHMSSGMIYSGKFEELSSPLQWIKLKDYTITQIEKQTSLLSQSFILIHMDKIEAIEVIKPID